MSDKQQPDKANPLDEDLNVPAYDSMRQDNPDVFARAGRAEPQEIRPQKQEAAETEVLSNPAANGASQQGNQQSAGEDIAVLDPAAAAQTEGIAAEDVSLTPEELAEQERKLQQEQEDKEGYKRYGRRGTIDFGLFFVRLAMSAYLMIAGVATFFSLGDGAGVSGLESDYSQYAWANSFALAVPTVQLIAGAFLLLGLISPLAAMLGLVVTGFTALHELAESGAGLEVFDWPDSVWLSLVLFVVAIGLQFTGPGFISLDFGRSWARRPLGTSWVFVVVGIAILVAVWFFGAAVNPIA
ncbi:DoxX family protein [Corynebacterium accolens]|uniref:DoxX family protein n=1 Tax=Corynebacterium accolens TaxID=38284 RepID=UPI00254CC675|nr:DoxX family membrane protein [Corynebacterium accolens]MDK8504875.1 DoxX family membrane protein [Corynebacterium accolens]MDK8661672.1 DoxX family membrane protein [Corynebacterium accolens]